jgi:hypothetical protein
MFLLAAKENIAKTTILVQTTVVKLMPHVEVHFSRLLRSFCNVM